MPTDPTDPVILIEGGLVRDVIGAQGWVVIDLDYENLTLQDVLDARTDADEALPDDYPDKPAILEDYDDAIAYLRTRTELASTPRCCCITDDPKRARCPLHAK